MGLAIVKFASLWNVDSRAFEEQFKQLSDEYKQAKFIVSDVNANQKLAKQEEINKIPTIVVYINGVSVARLTTPTKRQLREAIEYFLKKFKLLNL